MKNSHILSAFVILALIGPQAHSATHPTLAIGSPAPDFKLKGFVVAESSAPGELPRHHIQEKQYTLRDFSDAKILVLIFTCNHCPTAQAYEQRMIELVTDYQDKGVAIAGISINDPLAVRLDELGYTDLGDSYADCKIRAMEKGYNFPYLYDGDHQTLAQSYGPVATPHVFIFDQARKLRYTGRIDNAENPEKVVQHETREAIEALLAGKQPAVTQTRTFGCSIKWADKRASAKKALEQWNREIATLAEIEVKEIKALRANKTDRLRLINVWATWCGPCVTEFPDLVTINRMYRQREFDMISISLDTLENKDKALAFLNKQAASFQNYRFAGNDREQMGEALDPQWRGAIPYTLLIAPDGKIIYRHSGAIDPLEVKKAIVDVIGRYFFKPASL
ncbi:MAG: redoxin domain-containing protein [Phycisphaeraceae bacterium]|nr:redoxin domain-containing protein [Phycisphaeraceae bacterium]